MNLRDRIITDLRAEAGELGEADGVVDRIAGAHAPATELDDGDADGARVDRLHDPRPIRRNRAHDRCSRQILLRPLDEIGGTAKRRDHRGELLRRAA